MKRTLKVSLLLSALALAGCANATAEKYLGRTTASFGELKWDSTKNQENLDAEFAKDGDRVQFRIKTTAVTPEAAMAAAAADNAAAHKNMSEFLKELLLMLQRAAPGGSRIGVLNQ